jgi:hypothetical protein
MIDFKLIPEQSPSQLRTFGLLFGALIATVFGAILPFIFSFEYRLWPWYTGAFFASWALIHPASLKSVYRGWMHVALVLGFVNTHIIMFILFYGLFLPFGAVMRLFGWDAMQRKLSDKVDSYRVPSRPTPRNHMKNPF